MRSTRMSLEAQTDLEDLEDLEDLRTSQKKRVSSKPPSSPRSPYLSSLKLGSRRVAVSAWRPARSSLGDASVASLDPLGTAPSLINGHGASQSMRSEYNVTAQILSLTPRKHKQCPSTATGRVDLGDKEEMYDENIRLKKSLVDHKSDNQQMRAKLRRLEEEKARREKQIEQLLDPTKGPDYTRSFVDKSKEGSVVVKGLKQRILKLEQQCREKENALSNLQSELRTTSLEELKITVELYLEEIQRLKTLLSATEKSGRAELQGSHRRQKSLGAAVLRLSGSLKQLQLDNTALREGLSTDRPAEGVKGYREWSKQRLVRRLLELEKRLEADRKHARSAEGGCQSERGVQTTPVESLDVVGSVAMATDTEVPVAAEQTLLLRERVDGLEKEQRWLQETLASKDAELMRLKAEIQEKERWKDEQVKDREKERNQHREELSRVRTQTLERGSQRPAPPDCSPAAHQTDQTRSAPGPGAPEGVEGGQGTAQRGGGAGGRRRSRPETRLKEERDEAARTIQNSWREHRERAAVRLQSALRGHLLRQAQLTEQPPADAKSLPQRGRSRREHVCADGGMDVVAVTTIQSVFRGHLARCGLVTQSTFSPTPPNEGRSSPIQESGRRGSASTCPPSRPGGLQSQAAPQGARSQAALQGARSQAAPQGARSQAAPQGARSQAAPQGARPVDSDDSDDIIVSPTRPLRAREKMLS